MFAVIKAGGKQYRVIEDQVLKVEGVKGEPGEIVQIDDVIMLGGDTPQLGTPTISGASVAVEIVAHGRGPKIIAFKKRRRKNSKRKRGYRDEITVIRVTEILTDGKSPTVGPRPKKEKKVEAAPAEGDAPAKKAPAKKPAAKKAATAKATDKAPAAKKAPAKKAAPKAKSDKK